MDSCDSHDTDMDLPERSKREAESSRLNSKNNQMQNAKSARGRRGVPMESLNQQPAIIDFSSIRDDRQPVLRVPLHIKQLNPDAYEPCSISIGPVHHGQPKLLPMEAFKRRYAHNFINRFSIKIEELIHCTENWEGGLRDSYGIYSEEIPSLQFVKIMCTDAAFLAGFLLEEALPGPFDEKWNTIICDLFLLENQIPFYYLEEILALIKQPVLQLCDNFLDNIRPFGIGRCENKPCGEKEHLLDILRTRMAYKTNENGAPEVRRDLCPTISHLHQAGIEFYPNIKSYELTFQNGILKIPPFTLDQNTGTYFANLLASELFAGDRYSTDHIAIMECLIKGQQDVQILVERKILENFLKDDIAAVSLIKEIGRSIDVSRGFRYKPLVKVLNVHCEKFRASPWSMYLWKWKTNCLEWMRELTTNYFGTPWKTLSVIVAVILLTLTAAQTVFSYLQLKGS